MTTHERQEAQRVVWILWLFLAFFLFGLAEPLVSGFMLPDGMLPLEGMAFSLLTFGWYRADTDQQKWRRGWWGNTGMVWLSFLYLPVYFFRTRGGGGVGATFWMLGVAVAVNVCFFIGATVGLSVFRAAAF